LGAEPRGQAANDADHHSDGRGDIRRQMMSVECSDGVVIPHVDVDALMVCTTLRNMILDMAPHAVACEQMEDERHAKRGACTRAAAPCAHAATPSIGDVGRGVAKQESEHDIIPIPYVDASTMRKVLEYCQHHKHHATEQRADEHTHEKDKMYAPCADVSALAYVSDWDRTYVASLQRDGAYANTSVASTGGDGPAATVAACGVPSRTDVARLSHERPPPVRRRRSAVAPPDLSELYAVFNAANFLDIKPLLALCACALAERIRGKTPPQIRRDLGLPDDMDADEFRATRDERGFVCDDAATAMAEDDDGDGGDGDDDGGDDDYDDDDDDDDDGGGDDDDDDDGGDDDSDGDAEDEHDKVHDEHDDEDDADDDIVEEHTHDVSTVDMVDELHDANDRGNNTAKKQERGRSGARREQPRRRSNCLDADGAARASGGDFAYAPTTNAMVLVDDGRALSIKPHVGGSGEQEDDKDGQEQPARSGWARRDVDGDAVAEASMATNTPHTALGHRDVLMRDASNTARHAIL